MNRKIILTATFIASFFLIFLGMRNPYLSGDSGPKQRPRAIVENTTNKPSDLVQQLSFEAPGLPPMVAISHNQYISRLEYASTVSFSSFISSSNLPARASPEVLIRET